MKKRLLNLLACAFILPLTVSCSGNEPSPEPTPELPSTYKVSIDKSFGHISVEGKRDDLHEGDAVSLTITAIDDFILVDSSFRVYTDNESKSDVEFRWTADTSKLEFTMPSNDVVVSGGVRDSQYEIVLDKYTHLDGGDVEVNGVHLHFDENMVTEDCDEGFVKLAPYGSLYLESYLPGITEVFVEEIYDGEPDGGFNLGKAATPNSIDGTVWYSQTTSRVILSPDTPYFVINNREKENIIKYVKIKYAPDESENALKELVKVEDLSTTFTPGFPLNPYEVNPIDESLIPENRIVKPIQPLEYDEPGEYVYGYEVYSKTSEGDPCKLLYSSHATVRLSGNSNFGYWAIFHLKDSTAFIPVGKNRLVDISKNDDVKKYNWNNKYNDFVTPFTSDRHFYPTYSVIGLPNHKNADGCYPVSITYSAFDGHIEMPEPTMKPGYIFGGWFFDYECTRPFDPYASYSDNYTLYAKCMEDNKNYRKVYYYDFDGTILNHVDYLEEKDDAKITLPTFEDIGTTLVDEDQYQTKMYELRMGTNRIKMLRPAGHYPINTRALGPDDEYTYSIDPLGEDYAGDTLDYNDVKTYHGDIHLIVSRAEIYVNPLAGYTLFFKDVEDNTVASGFTMDEVYRSGDRILTGRYVDWNEDWSFDYTTYYDPQRCDEFTLTDAVDGYIIDQGSYNSIASYGYGNKYLEHAKPLQGIIRHDSVLKVNRRAFFNRYGIQGTYFPKNAREFALESYSNTHFNGTLMLPTNLSKIGARAFVGSTNIKTVCLPKSLSSVGKGAFSLADYNESLFEFQNIRYREGDDKILFYYEGSEKDFAKLDDVSQNEILNNASQIIFNTSYTPYYGK